MSTAKRKSAGSNAPITDSQIRELVALVEEQARLIADINARLSKTEQTNLEKARMGRIGRAAARAGMTVEAWLKHCERIGNPDPTLLDEKTRKRIAREDAEPTKPKKR